MTITTDKDSAPGSWRKEIEIRTLQGTLSEAMAYSREKWLADGRRLWLGDKDEKLVAAMLDVLEAVGRG